MPFTESRVQEPLCKVRAQGRGREGGLCKGLLQAHAEKTLGDGDYRRKDGGRWCCKGKPGSRGKDRVGPLPESNH